MKKMTCILIFLSMIQVGFSQEYETIILINGEPNLVHLDAESNLSKVIRPVPYYFDSNLSHSEIVISLMMQRDESIVQEETQSSDNTNAPKADIIESDVAVHQNAEIIKFIPGKALLDNIAVNRIRNIARDCLLQPDLNIFIDVNHQNTAVSRLLSTNRIHSVRDLLIAFGVSSDKIITNKQLSDLDTDAYVRIRYDR